MSKSGAVKMTVVVIVLSFVFGTLGSIVSDRFILPSLYRQYTGFNNDNGNESVRPIIQPKQEVLAESSVINVAKEVSPSVVSIVVTKELPNYYRNPYDLFFNDPFGQDPFGFPQPRTQPVPAQPKTEKQKVGGGSGFIITQDGLVFTNKHVVDDTQADYTVITKDGTEYKAEVVTKDPLNDMAIVRMKTKDDKNVSNMPVVKFVSDINNTRVGQMVVAIGNALAEFDNTVTLGVISAKGREITASGGYGTQSEALKGLLQTDASINPGNSGGPLVNLEGEVIGMNTAIASDAQGIGFAIPLDEQIINKIIAQVKQYGRIVRPFLGIRYVNVTPELNKQYNLGTDSGAWIKSDQDLPSVIADSPAAKAGLKGGDIVIKVSNKPLGLKYVLQDALGEYNPGDTITLTVLRDGKNQDIKVVLEERKEEATSTPQNNVNG